MTTDNLKKINSILELKQLRRVGSAMLKGQEKQDFGRIQEKFDNRRTTAERLYAHEYITRVEIEYDKLDKRSGENHLKPKPPILSLDRGASSNAGIHQRQAQLNVRLDHQQSMGRFDVQEMKEGKSFLEKSSQRKTYLETFANSAERRRTQTRRHSADRRQSPTMSD